MPDGREEVESSGLARVLGGAGAAVGPVGKISVALAEGYGYGVSTGRSEVASSGLAIEVAGAVGPAVGTTMVSFPLGRGNGTPVPIGATSELEGAEPIGAITVPFPTG
jgi:hypothetical protein